MLEIVDIRDAAEKEIKEYTQKQESPERQQGTVGDAYEQSRETPGDAWTGKERSHPSNDNCSDPADEKGHGRSDRGRAADESVRDCNAGYPAAYLPCVWK